MRSVLHAANDPADGRIQNLPDGTVHVNSGGRAGKGVTELGLYNRGTGVDRNGLLAYRLLRPDARGGKTHPLEQEGLGARCGDGTARQIVCYLCKGMFHFFMYFQTAVRLRPICRATSALFQSQPSSSSTNISRVIFFD